MPTKKPKRRALTAEELDAEQGAELPKREALSIVFGPTPSLMPAVQAAQTAAAPAAEEVAPVQPEP